MCSQPHLYGNTACHMGSHSVICHRAEVTFPPLCQPYRAGTRFSDREGIPGWVDLVGWSHTKWSPIPALTEPTYSNFVPYWPLLHAANPFASDQKAHRQKPFHWIMVVALALQFRHEPIVTTQNPLVVFLMELLGGLRERMDAWVVYAAGTSAGSTLRPRQRETRVHT